MNFLSRSLGIGLCACAISSCQTAGRVLQMPINLLKAVGRTAGLNAQVESEPNTDKAIAARGKMIQDQGAYGAPGTSPAAEHVANR